MNRITALHHLAYYRLPYAPTKRIIIINKHDVFSSPGRSLRRVASSAPSFAHARVAAKYRLARVLPAAYVTGVHLALAQQKSVARRADATQKRILYLFFFFRSSFSSALRKALGERIGRTTHAQLHAGSGPLIMLCTNELFMLTCVYLSTLIYGDCISPANNVKLSLSTRRASMIWNLLESLILSLAEPRV